MNREKSEEDLNSLPLNLDLEGNSLPLTKFEKCRSHPHAELQFNPVKSDNNYQNLSKNDIEYEHIEGKQDEN